MYIYELAKIIATHRFKANAFAQDDCDQVSQLFYQAVDRENKTNNGVNTSGENSFRTTADLTYSQENH